MREKISNYYLASLPNLIYATAVEDSPSRKFHFIQTGKKSPAGDLRFLEQGRIGLEICNALGIEYKCYPHEKAHEAQLDRIDSSDFIDIRLYNQKRIRNKPKFLGLNPEYLSVSIPKISSGNHLQLKLRIEQIIRIFLAKMIISYISIDTKQRRGLFFKSKSINRELLTINLRKLQSVLSSELPKADREILSALAQVKRVAVIFPLLEQFGGNDKYHERMFREILIELNTNDIDHVLIKSHPTDNRDFSVLAQKHFFSKNFYLLSEGSNSLPVEIILSELKFDLYGTFSTAMLGLNHLASFPTKLYLPIEKPWRDFLNYSQSSQYALIDHRLKYI